MMPKRWLPIARERGVIALVLLALFVSAALYLLLDRLSRAALERQREEITSTALADAKAALIGRAAADVNRPGSLPCPDTDGDGSAEVFSGNQCPSYVGRLPWRTIGLTRFRDATGETLWYALSPAFRDDDSAEPLNSDTQGQLTLTGPMAGSNFVALLFAPGEPKSGQNRVSPNLNDSAHYLDDANSTPAASPSDTFDKTFTSTGSVDSFNDRVLPITHAELFAVVENAVAKRIEKEIKPQLNAHFAAWGAFPFAADFSPNTVTKGVAGQWNGYLPAVAVPTVDDDSRRKWSNADCKRESGIVLLFFCNCAVSGSGDLSCNFFYIVNVGSLVVNISATLADAGLGFVSVPDAALATGFTSAPTVTVKLKADGKADAEYVEQVPVPALGVFIARAVTIGRPAFEQVVTSSDYAWFRNNWLSLTYYAASQDVLPRGLSAPPSPAPSLPACVANCLTVNNAASPNNNDMVLILAGRALSDVSPSQTGTHPVSQVDRYLENQNATPNDRIFETGRRTSLFNDRVVIVRP